MIEIDKTALGQRINLIRVKRKETLEEFADNIKKKTEFKIKTTKSNVSKWEKGQNIPNDITLKAIATLGNMAVDELLYGTSSEEFEAAETLLNELVNEGNRHFFEVDDETKKQLISIAIEKNKSLFLNKNRNDINLKTLLNYIESTFEDYYYENVIADSSAIMIMLRDLESLKSRIADYYEKPAIYTISDNLSLVLSLEEDNLNQELGKELVHDLDNLLEKYQALIETVKDIRIKNQLKIHLLNHRTDISNDETLSKYLEVNGEEKFKNEIIQMVFHFMSEYKNNTTDKEIIELTKRYKEDLTSFLNNKPFLN